jgi:regulator of sigma E protease
MGTTIILGIISIGILIFVHELGHFLAARAAGIRVEVFSIGWGKGYVLFTWKETKVQIGWIPFGGYCKLAGDSPRDEIENTPGEYYSSSPLRRIMVALGGPFFNYFFAAILFAAIIMIGFDVNTYTNKIILSSSEDIPTVEGKTPAQLAGMQDGDVIVAISGKEIKSWDDITENIVRNALKDLDLDIRRGGVLLKLMVRPQLDEETGRGFIGIHPWVEPVIGRTIPGESADLAGLKPGDRILSVDGKSVQHHVDFYEAIEGKSQKTVVVSVERSGQILSLNMIPKIVEGYDYADAGLVFRQISYRSEKYPVPVAVGKGFAKSAEAVRDTVRGIGLVFSGKIRARSAVAGPAKLIYISGVIAKEGFIYFLQVMSYISIAFFIMNLIPFPALDGSHIVISLSEIVTRKKPNLELIHKIQAFGFIFLIVALIFITMNDISSFLGR